jgi:hypothetical protein
MNNRIRVGALRFAAMVIVATVGIGAAETVLAPGATAESAPAVTATTSPAPATFNIDDSTAWG